MTKIVGDRRSAMSTLKGEVYDITREGKVIRDGRELKFKKGNGQGHYRSVIFSIEGKKKQHLVHRLVAEKFIPNPDNLPEVNHKNKNKKDNRVENLEWVTRKQNCTHSTGKRVQLEKEGVSMWFPSIGEAGRFLSCNSGNVSRLIRGIKYTHIKGWKLCQK